MSDVGLKAGLAFLSGAYLSVNLACLYWLVSQRKARLQEEAQKETERDHFYDKYQTVVDLTCLTCLGIEDAKKALLDEKFKTPISERIAETLEQTDKPDWQRVYLSRKTRKSSYDDLKMIEASLKEKGMPHLMTKRRNPVRFKTGNDILLARECICDSRGHVHEDLRRHVLSRRSVLTRAGN